jgi:hypothetical protein
MNDYNRRQIHIALEQIEAFKTNKVDIGLLIANLEALAGTLQGISREWMDLFWQHWGALEEVYAITLDEKRDKLKETEDRLVNVSLTKLTHLFESINRA